MILRWADWPDDVRPILRDWNWRRLLRFGRRPHPFWCASCGTQHDPNPNGDAEIVSGVLCDDCLMALVRKVPPSEITTTTQGA